MTAVTLVLCVSQGHYKSHIRVHEDANGSIYTVGITTKPVNSLSDVSVVNFQFNEFIALIIPFEFRQFCH